MKILLVEDDDLLGNIALSFLSQEASYQVTWVKNGQSALTALGETTFNLVLLDLILPDMHGHDILKSISQQAIKQPVIVLTSDQTENKEVQSLKLGADDHVLKPFSEEQLLARIEAVMRRYNTTKNQVLQFDDINLDLLNLTATKTDKNIVLTQSEFKLIKELALNTDQIFSRDDLNKIISLDHKNTDSNTIDVHIHSLRKKFANKQLIETVRGAGYRLNNTLKVIYN